MSKFCDNYGDPLFVSPLSRDRVSIAAEEGSDSAELEFNSATAAEVAFAILKAAGKEVTPIEEFKLASEVSFNEALLRVAALHKRTVTFRYAKGAQGGYIETRTLNPESVTGNGELVTGHDPDREGVRCYRLDRIKGEVAFA